MYYVTTKTAPVATKNPAKINVLSVWDKREAARSEASTVGGTVRTEDEINKLIEAGKLNLVTLPGYVAPEPTSKPKTLIELAKEIKAKNRQRRTVGKRERVSKRVVTPEAVVAAATEFARSQVAAGVVKVALVKAVSWWASEDGTRLQRRDVFTVLHAVGAVVADATISTQFQIVRAAGLAAK